MMRNRIDEFDECSGCGLSIWKCTLCGYYFVKGDKVFCVNDGEEHVCAECIDY